MRARTLVLTLAASLAGMACAEYPPPLTTLPNMGPAPAHPITQPPVVIAPTPSPPPTNHADPTPQPSIPSAQPTAPPEPPPDLPVYDEQGRQRGIATWYGTHENGRRTASGEPLSDRKLTAAHKTLPLGTRVRVTNLKNGRMVVVRITDRGPYGRGHIIDMSRAAARALGMIEAGMVPVTIEIIHH